MADPVIVRVQGGLLKGRNDSQKNGSMFFSFQGVPYAIPPVGPLRFKPAQPIEPWVGVREALVEGPTCPQIDWILKLPFRGEEDCLYLNVYTPKLPNGEEKLKLPVMVWIHGGGFEIGCGDANLYGPHYLVNEGIVLVTINYRLGIFGFLSLNHELQADNIGLKDQVAALRWVQRNIEAFGGDPTNVTIFGESAGAASVNYHMLSPMSEGLFQKAIMESGCALNGWTRAKDPRELAFAIGKELGCITTDEKELLRFLADLKAKDLVETTYKVRRQTSGEQWRFGPVVESRFNTDEEVFLPSCPVEMMKNGNFKHLPCIIGVNSQEGIFYASIIEVLNNPKNLKHIGESFETQVPYDIVSKKSRREIADDIRRFYFNNEELSEVTLNQFIDFTSDMWFIWGINQAVEFISSKESPVYYYCFKFSGQLNIYKNFVQAHVFKGASHMDELGYLFTTPFFSTPEPDRKSPEWLIHRRLVVMWTNFAKNGNPTPRIDDILTTTWSPYTMENPVCLNITGDLCLVKDEFKERLKFWKDV